MPCKGEEYVSQATKRISVVVPAHNAAATVTECLLTLNQQSVPRELYEIIVVDDGSTDDTAQLAAREGAIVLRQMNQGAAAARNCGVAAARGEIVLFTDADCAPASDWIEQMLLPLVDPHIMGTKGVYRTRQTGWTARFVQVEYEDRYDHTARCPYVDLVDTYSAGYRRTVLLSSGGFDPRIRFVEDQELSFRLADAGCRMVFCPRAVVYHHHVESWLHYARKKYHIGRWKVSVLRLHPGKARRDSHTPLSVKIQMLLAAFSAALALASLKSGMALWPLSATLGAFVLSAGPFVAKVWRRDRTLVLVSLPALYLRAWALGLGLLAGYWDELLGRSPLDHPHTSRAG